MSKIKNKESNNDIAIIGLSGLFPGSDSLDQFWQNLIDNKDCRSVATEKQMGRDALAFLGEPGADDSFYCINGGYINDFSMDAKDINMSEERLAALDDVYRWSLYVAREALKDSGYLNKVKNINAGVILGNLSFPTKQSNQLFIPMYHKAINSALIENLEEESLVLPRYAKAQNVGKEAGLLAGYPAALIAEAFSLKASKFCLDAACASSIYSVKLACDYLLTGRSDLMLAGAVSAADPFFVNLGFSVFHAYPENQISAPLDKRSQGLFAGEGAGMLVLKRLEDALADGDHIRAVIKGGGLSNDGKGQHVLSPNTKGQVKAFERAYENANVDPASVDYIECHATGTPLGDKVELTSLENFFKPHLEKAAKNAPSIGSVKSNLGHLLTAAGMPAMTKIIMAMENNIIPASINLEQKQKSPKGLFSEDQICSENMPWEKENKEPKRAGVSVFGFGGANAHMIFEEAPRTKHLTKSLAKQSSNNKKIQKQQRMSIVGMDAHFGSCKNLAEFECLILEDKNVFRELPSSRWRGLEDEQIIKKAFGDKIPKGGYLESFDLDFLDFKLPPHMDERLIPQQLLMMKVANNALKDAKIQAGGRVAVLVAMGTELELHQIRARVNLNAQFDELWENSAESKKFTAEQKEEITRLSKNSIHHKARLNQYTSAIGNIMASRISSIWDFSGPAFTVSAEENSVCQALELAQVMFEQDEVDAVVVAAVDLSASVESLLLRQQFGPMHKDGTAFSFDETNQGWCVGEGAGAIVLEKAGQNRRAADEKTIYAEIDALSFANGIESKDLEEAAKNALINCDYDFKDLEYWELSASGFAEQDQNELDAVLTLASTKNNKNSLGHLAIGSVKNNVGHSYAASGIASLIKTALCLHNRSIPAVSSWHSPKNKKEQWNKSALYIPTISKTWFKDTENPIRHAAINSMGLDGRSCFIAMSEDKSNKQRMNAYLRESQGQLFKFHAESEHALLAEIDNFTEYAKLKQMEGLSLKALADEHYWSTSNKQVQADHEHADENNLNIFVLVANEFKSLSNEIDTAKKGIVEANKNIKDWFSPAGSYYTPKALGQTGKVSFVYPGAFNSYLNIVKDLAQLFPELHSLFAKHSGQAATLFADTLYYPRSIEKLSVEQEKVLQRALPDAAISSFENGISVSVALTDVLKNVFGVQPSTAFGYSMGEISMMYALGVWGTTDAMSKRLRANPVFQTRLAGSMDTLRDAWQLKKSVKDGSFWSGFALLAPVEKIKQAVAKEKYVRLILINTDNEAVIAGKPEDCRRVAESLQCDFFEAALGDVIHCDWVRSDYNDLKALHILDVNKNNDVDFFTAVGNKKLSISSSGVASNIAEMYCNPVDFVALTNSVYKDGSRIFIELGARDNCSRHIGQILKDKDHVCVSLNRKGSSDKSNLLRALAKLVSHGVDVDLSRLYESPKVKDSKKQLMVNVQVGGKRVFDELKALTDIKNTAVIKNNIDHSKHDVSSHSEKTVINPKAENQPVFNLQNKIASEQKTVNPTFIKNIVSSNNESRVMKSSSKHQDTENHLNYSKIPASVIEGFNHNILRLSAAHEVFLDYRKQNLKAIGDLISRQLSDDLPSNDFYRAVTEKSNNLNESVSKKSTVQFKRSEKKLASFDQSKVQYPNADLKNIIWGPQDLVEFAEGDIANVFGEEFKIIDSYSRRVRLPTTEYLLVDRVTKLKATVNKYEACSMTTEYDVPYDFWYSAKGQIPWAVAVESGQCDLLLISYLGIDFLNKGERVYRLLDCELTFMDDVAMEGDTLRYDISINSYARSGDGFLFFFSYDCYVGDQLVLKMRNGAAGFFSDEELEVGKGVIETDKEKKARLAIVKQSFTPLLQCSKTQFNYQDMMALCEGNLAACFGQSYYQPEDRNPNLVYSAPKMLMIERITELDLKGGSWGLGLLVGEKTLDPEHWYFPCHFKDDQVMAGSLMSDGCSQLLRFYTWYLGLHTLTEDAVFQPIPNLGQQVRCRGQVVPQHGTLIYRMEITEIGTHPKPYAKANVDIILNGKIVVDFKNLGLFLGEIAGTELERKINRRKRVLAGDYSNTIVATKNASEENKILAVKTASKVLHEGHVYVPGQYEIREHSFAPFPGNPNDLNTVPDTLPFTQFHFIEFATGRIANCFGEKFGGIYDGRTPPRTPNADLQLTSRVLEIDGERNDLKRISSTLAEFDNPADAWYYTENTHPDLMPYSIIMEISLQPNGFISAWVGTTLKFPERDLYFRNLDGSGTLLKNIDLRGKTIRNKSTLLSTTAAGNTIIQSFKYDLSVDGEVFYEGTSVFGYFLKDALTHQLGLDKGRVVEPWHVENKVPDKLLKSIDLRSAQAKKDYYQAKDNKPYYRLANPKLDLIERVVLSSTAGNFNLGYIYAEKTIDKNDWFFPCHFHQDPVMPGSLGVEAILQAMQLWALDNELGKDFKSPRFIHELSTVKWKYRGQIIPDNKIMSLDVHISKVEKLNGKVVIYANASLYKDGLRIYELADAQVALCEA